MADVTKCRLCKNPAKNVCAHGNCPDCHFSITFEMCLERTEQERAAEQARSKLP